MKSRPTTTLLAALLMAAAGLSQAADTSATLAGAQENPPVVTAAQGVSKIAVRADKSVSGSVTTTGIVGTMAHIHLAPAGKNGPPIITLEKKSATEWSVPSGSVLTDEQYAAFKAGNLYVNIHSEAHRSGEIRAQLLP